MKHLCVFWAFRNIDDIKTSFESLYLNDIDYFVVENKSENSYEIENYFLTKRLRGYIQFEENIGPQALTIFIKDFKELLEEYDIITITDGDLYVVDAREAFNEIIDNLNSNKHIMFSSIMVYEGNAPQAKDQRIIGLENFKKVMSERNVPAGPVFRNTGHWLMTFKKESLFFFNDDLYYIDWTIYKTARAMRRTWVHTNKNLAYHLTWDKCFKDNEYYVWKRDVFGGKPGWQKYKNVSCPYKKIERWFECSGI